MEKIDLFDTYEKLPKKVKDILSKPIYNSVMTYARCKRLVKELENVGYTCDYGLDASPYNLKKMATKKTTALKWEKHKDGHEVSQYKFGSIIRLNGTYQIRYFGTIGTETRHATSLADAKKQLEIISNKKTKSQAMATKKPTAKKPNNKGLISLLKKNILFWEKELKKPNVSSENKKFFINEISENKKVIANLEKADTGLKGLPSGMTKSIAKTIKVTGLRKEDGTLQKGYKYAKGGKIVKAKVKKKDTKTAK